MRTSRVSEFSMTKMGEDFQSGRFAEFAPYSDKNVVPPSLMGGKNFAQGAAKRAEVNAAKAGAAIDNAVKATGKAGAAIRNAAGKVGEVAVNAKNKVAVLVKGANGKAFIQQRWKNVQDAGKAVGGAARQAGGAIKANPGKSAAIAGAVGLAGGGIYALSRRKD